MAEQAKISEAELVVVIGELNGASPERQEEVCRALEKKHGSEVAARARQLLVERRTAQITAELKATEAELEAKEVELDAKRAKLKSIVEEIKVKEEEVETEAETEVGKGSGVGDPRGVLEELAGLWNTDPIEYAKKKRVIADRLGVAESIVEEAVKRVREGRSEEEGQSQATRLMALGLTTGRVRLWPSVDGMGHASVWAEGHWEHYRIRSSGFENWLRDEYGKGNQVNIGGRMVAQVPGAQAVRDAVASLDGYAKRHGEPKKVSMRVGGDGEMIWIDLGRKDWNAVKVTADGWDVVRRSGVPFVRTETMLPLPVPRRGGDVRDLGRVLNVRDEDLVLIAGWLLQVLNPIGDYPFIDVCGESENGKTFLCVTLLTVVDPRTTKLRRLRSVDDLMVSALNNWAMGFDNWSTMSRDVADTLCMISTEISIGKRRLYSDDEEHTFTVRRPIIFNGIPSDLTERSDLASRTILLNVPKIERRRRKADLEREFGEIWPGVLGALMDGLVGGLRDQAAIEVADPARLMDFEAFAEAGCRAMGFGDWEFVEAYKANRMGQMVVAAEASPVGQAAIKWLKLHPKGFRGQASVLLGELQPWNEGLRNWPRTPARLSSELSRVAKPLGVVGITCRTGVDRRYDRERPGTQHDVILEWVTPPADEVRPLVQPPVVIRSARPKRAAPAEGAEVIPLARRMKSWRRF